MLSKIPWRSRSPSSCFISCPTPAETDQLLHSGCLMSELHLRPRRAGLSSASINSPRPSKEPHESRCLKTAYVNRGGVSSFTPRCLAVWRLPSASVAQVGSPSRHPPTRPSSQRPCLPVPGLSPSHVRAIVASSDLDCRPRSLTFSSSSS